MLLNAVGLIALAPIVFSHNKLTKLTLSEQMSTERLNWLPTDVRHDEARSIRVLDLYFLSDHIWWNIIDNNITYLVLANV